MENIGSKIRQYREEAGISQKKLGLALGLSDKAISAYESNRTLPPIETLHRIAQELEKPLKYFIIAEDEDSVDERLDRIEKQLKSMLETIEELRASIGTS